MLGKVSTKIKEGGSFSAVNHFEKENFEVGKSLEGIEFKPFNSEERRIIQDDTKIKKISYVFGNMCVAETKKAIYFVRNNNMVCFSDNHYIIRAKSVPKYGQRIIPKKPITKNYHGTEKGPYAMTDVIKDVKKISKGIFLATSDYSKYLVILEE